MIEVLSKAWLQTGPLGLAIIMKTCYSRTLQEVVCINGHIFYLDPKCESTLIRPSVTSPFDEYPGLWYGKMSRYSETGSLPKNIRFT